MFFCTLSILKVIIITMCLPVCLIFQQIRGGRLMNIAIGGDPNAAGLKNIIISHLQQEGHTCLDYGSDDVIYANVAIAVAEAVVAEKHDRGILICGTGIGMCIAANKVLGAYAATCHDPYSTERSIKSNNANIMTLGAFVLGHELAKALVTTWLAARYIPGGSSEPKVQRIIEYCRLHEKQSSYPPDQMVK
jgi:ribose 5-phosphate isomerase B